jgi:hypothetical protein
MKILVTSLALSLFCLSANAAVIVSTNTADFNLTTEAFPNVSLGTNANIVSTSGNITLDNAQGIGSGSGDATGTHGYTNFSSIMPGDEYVLNGDENFNIIFSSIQTAFAMDYLDDNIISTFNLTFLNGSSSVGVASFTTAAADFDSVQFVGFTSSIGFDNVQVREDDGTGNANEFFQFYTATQTVPEPGTFALLGLCLSLFSFGFKRPQRDSVSLPA